MKLLILLSMVINYTVADFLYCNHGVKIYHSNYSASLQQSNGTRGNFEYHSKFNTDSGKEIIVYRGTDIPAVLSLPKNINGNTNVVLELDGNPVIFKCHE